MIKNINMTVKEREIRSLKLIQRYLCNIQKKGYYVNSIDYVVNNICHLHETEDGMCPECYYSHIIPYNCIHDSLPTECKLLWSFDKGLYKTIEMVSNDLMKKLKEDNNESKNN